LITERVVVMENDWQSDPRRACRDQPREWFYPVTYDAFGNVDEDAPEPPWPSPEAKAVCDACPVQGDCLQYALDHFEAYGVWGGLSAYQRELLTKPLLRKTCPGCGSYDIVITDRDELCIACGVSWPII